jgi:hypothetical protein
VPKHLCKNTVPKCQKPRAENQHQQEECSLTDFGRQLHMHDM